MAENELQEAEEPKKERRHRSKPRDPENLKNLISRLNRVEGQIRGVKRMLEEGVHNHDVIIQMFALTAALNSVSKVIFLEHMQNCIPDEIRNGNQEAIDELVIEFNKLIRA